MNLYEISRKYQLLQDEIAANDGEIPMNWETTFNDIDATFEDKIHTLVCLIGNNEADKEKLFLFRKKLLKKEAKLLRNIEAMKANILNAMKVTNTKILHIDIHKITRRQRGADIVRVYDNGEAITQEEINFCDEILKANNGDYTEANLELGRSGLQYKINEYIHIG